MPAKRYPVLLDSEQRESLIGLISIGKDSARKLTRARILLKADESEFGAAAYADKQIKKRWKSRRLPLSERAKPSCVKVSSRT